MVASFQERCRSCGHSRFTAEKLVSDMPAPDYGLSPFDPDCLSEPQTTSSCIIIFRCEQCRAIFDTEDL